MRTESAAAARRPCVRPPGGAKRKAWERCRTCQACLRISRYDVVSKKGGSGKSWSGTAIGKHHVKVKNHGAGDGSTFVFDPIVPRTEHKWLTKRWGQGVDSFCYRPWSARSSTHRATSPSCVAWKPVKGAYEQAGMPLYALKIPGEVAVCGKVQYRCMRRINEMTGKCVDKVDHSDYSAASNCEENVFFDQ